MLNVEVKILEYFLFVSAAHDFGVFGLRFLKML